MQTNYPQKRVRARAIVVVIIAASIVVSTTPLRNGVADAVSSIAGGGATAQVVGPSRPPNGLAAAFAARSIPPSLTPYQRKKAEALLARSTVVAELFKRSKIIVQHAGYWVGKGNQLIGADLFVKLVHPIDARGRFPTPTKAPKGSTGQAYVERHPALEVRGLAQAEVLVDLHKNYVAGVTPTVFTSEKSIEATGGAQK